MVAQQWADITSADGSYGISVMNDSKYGWDKPDNHTLRLTLLNTPAVGKDPNMAHQEHLDMGHHTLAIPYMVISPILQKRGLHGKLKHSISSYFLSLLRNMPERWDASYRSSRPICPA